MKLMIVSTKNIIKRANSFLWVKLEKGIKRKY